MFCTKGGPEDKQDNVYHLAHMIALLGPPPKEFLKRTKGDRVRGWFDEKGVYSSVHFTDRKIFLYILHIRWQETGGGVQRFQR